MSVSILTQRLWIENEELLIHRIKPAMCVFLENVIFLRPKVNNPEKKLNAHEHVY